MESKRLIVTGCSGFIGVHVVKYFLEYTGWEIIGIDSFRHKGTYSRLNEVINSDNFKRIEIFHHDLSVPIDQVLQNKIGKVDYIINLASNSAVERSISDPVECWKNNCDLISNVLEYARAIEPELFIAISTDEVYGDAHHWKKIDPDFKGFKEWSVILPSNPYAASKAAQEALCIAYWRTYDMPIVITNTMNNIGEWQDTEKFLPRIISQISQRKKLSIYTDNEGGIGARVYLDAQDHAHALHFLILNQGRLNECSRVDSPPRFNICGNVELDNLDMAQLVCNIMKKEFEYELVPAKSARPGYDKTYLLDPSLMEWLGWKPPSKIQDTVRRVVDYSLANPWWIK